ncbi:MAG TPA: HIT family hydrolase, partial [Phenylobacterium sp.]
MRHLLTAAATAMAFAATAPAFARNIPAAVISDPAPDAKHPTRNQQALVPSGGVGMNAEFMLAGGAGPHGTVILFHGIPGNEQNLDLA